MSERRPRGRPRSFETEEALESALTTFRRHGYSGTSMADLTEATGLNRPSLYAAFGNKQALFEASVDHYWDHVASRCLPALEAGKGLAADLRGFLFRLIDVFAREEPGGCVIACGLPAEVDRHPELREKLAGFFAAADRAVARRLEVAREAGELPADAHPRRLAELVVSTMFALSLRSRAGTSRGALRRQAEVLIGQLIR